MPPRNQSLSKIVQGATEFHMAAKTV